MLRYMMESGAEIIVNDKQIPLEKDNLWAVSYDADNTKSYTKPPLDSEWYGADKNGTDKEKQFTLTNLCGDPGNYIYVDVTPTTCHYEKANEMFHFMQHGIDNAVSISFPTDEGMKPVMKKGKPISTAISSDNFVVTEHYIPNWATTESSSLSSLIGNEAEPDFTAAVESISVDEKRMEQ